MTPDGAPTKFLAVFGTRPEAIKMAPVLRELGRRSEEGLVKYAVCVTAQHRRMLDQVLDIFGIRPDYDLDLMTESQTPTQVAAAVLSRIEPVLAAERPDYVIVQGDTTTVAATSLASYCSGIRVAHVEAGLRTHDKWQPFPEEVNRRIASVIADLHFAPTESAKRNLLKEGIPGSSIVVAGNTVIDSLQEISSMPRPSSVSELLDDMRASSGDKLLLVTAHRRENFGSPMEEICAALIELARDYSQIRFVFPVHLNPAVRHTVFGMLAGIDNIRLINPVDYVSMVHLMDASYLVLTDSGGIQEEAPALGKPVLVLRDTTERPEGIEARVARLVGTKSEYIVSAVRLLLEDKREYDRMSKAVNPYGDGRASNRIVRTLLGESTDEFIPVPRIN